MFFKYPDRIIVNSKNFQKEFLKRFNINTKMIYNPLNKLEILKKKQKKNLMTIFFQKKIILK